MIQWLISGKYTYGHAKKICSCLEMMAIEKRVHWPFQGGASFVYHSCYFCLFFCHASMHVCMLMPCGHLLGKGWPLGSRLWWLFVTLSLSNWCPGSGVVLDCIDSRFLPYFLLQAHWTFPAFPDHTHLLFLMSRLLYLCCVVTVKSFPVLSFNVVIITLVRIYTWQSFIALTFLLVSLKYLI